MKPIFTAIAAAASIQSVIAQDATISQMVQTYNANQARFHDQYRGRQLSGEAVVTEIRADVLGTGAIFFVDLNVRGSRVRCSTSDRRTAASLDKGKQVSFAGEIHDVVFRELDVRNCTFGITAQESADLHKESEQFNSELERLHETFKLKNYTQQNRRGAEPAARPPSQAPTAAPLKTHHWIFVDNAAFRNDRGVVVSSAYDSTSLKTEGNVVGVTVLHNFEPPNGDVNGRGSWILSQEYDCAKRIGRSLSGDLYLGHGARGDKRETRVMPAQWGEPQNPALMNAICKKQGSGKG